MKKILFIFLLVILCINISSCTNKKEIDNVTSLINNLPQVITLEDENLINNIIDKYNNLSTKEQSKVTNYDILEEKINELNSLKIEKENLDNALRVITLINELPLKNNIKLSDKDIILNVLNEYNLLNDAAKSKVENLFKLTELVTYVSNFDEVLSVINEIDQLPTESSLTILDESKVLDAKKSYDKLGNDLKHLVSNYNKLENLLVKLEEINKQIEEDKKHQQNANKVINLINNIKEVITINDKEQIYKCVDEFNKLTDEEQALVTNFEKLNAAIKKLEEIIANTSYNVKVELDGGYLDNMIEIDKTLLICEFLVNNYSCNIWSNYSNNIFVYKTSLMNKDDKFTSFLKIGLKETNDGLNYVVEQIISAGTPLEQSDKICNYYILVHPDYNEGFSKVISISEKNKVVISKSFLSEASSTFGASLKVYSDKEESDYYISVKGMTTLPVPTKAGYKFVGWYTSNTYETLITNVKEECTIYALWEIDKGEITTETILNSVSNIVESNTIDELITENSDAYFKWSSSNNNLYNISNGIGKTSRLYQTHKKQTVTVSVEITYKTGGKKTLSKEVTINPVKFNNFSSTPIATYFYTGAVSAYKKYNERYLSNQTLFSSTTKETLDIVYYAFITPNSDGTVSMDNDSYINEVKELKNHNVRVLGCVNGVGTSTSTAFKVVTQDATLRKKFVNNLMDMVEKYNLDGLDLDWEAVSSSLKPIASQYNLLCEELREEMTKRQDDGGSPYLLTMAVPASSYGTATDRFDFKTLNKYCDFINIMSYDLNDSSKATHLSPLYTSKKDNGYGFGAVYGVDRISSLGFDKNKLIIGCAGYGKAYKVSSGSGTYPALGTSATLTQISGYDGSFASGTVYGSTINQLIKTGKYIEYTELDSSGRVVGSYLYSKTDNIFITYDSKVAVMAKYEYAKSIGVGMMCWAYTEDTSDTVVNAIYEAKNK